MRDPTSSLAEYGPHDEAEVLLPWYATGQLDEQDRLVVERHSTIAPECRAQLAIEKRLTR